MNIQEIGTGVEHRGYRVPSVINARSFPDDIQLALRPLYRLIEEEVETAFEARSLPLA
jgi:hypothetical protein